MKPSAVQFADFYRENPDKFPIETQSSDYFERLRRSYPIHPEIFDRLYEDWSTLDKFQRTRGVLQYLAVVIHRLWAGDNMDALIMPGSLPLEDSNVRNKSIHYLPQGWEPVIEREVDGPRSIPYDIDTLDTRFGSVQAARRTARTIFLGSAPSTQEQMIRGIQSERILLGAVQPGQTIGVFEDILKRLRDRLHYLYSDKDRYWLDTKPNLRREMESRKQTISEQDELLPLLKERVTRVFGRSHHFSGIHVFTPAADIPDEYGTGPKLVVLPLGSTYSRNETNQAFEKAENILRYRGDQPRQKQNRLIFLAPDFNAVSQLKEQGRTYLAWKSIVTDIENGILNQDLTHLNQAKRHRDNAEQSLTRLVRETYRWLLAPTEVIDERPTTLKWEVVSVSPTAPNLIQAIEDKLRKEEWVIYEWSPVHLSKLLKQWYLKDGVTEVSALKVWQDTCHYLYFPRLVNDTVFRNTIAQGVTSKDYFGFASGKEGDRYLGFSFGQNAITPLDESSLLIDREAAAAYAERIQEASQKTPSSLQSNEIEDITIAETTTGEGIRSQPALGVKESSNTEKTAAKKHFYGTVALDPVRAKMDFATIMDEVVQQFTAKLGIDVKISIEIEARSRDGFDESLQRAVKENCNVLRFSNAEFEEE